MHGMFASRYIVLNAHKRHTEIKGTEFAQISHQGHSILAYLSHMRASTQGSGFLGRNTRLQVITFHIWQSNGVPLIKYNHPLAYSALCKTLCEVPEFNSTNAGE